MADGPLPTLSDLLHELAERLQATGTYLRAARVISGQSTPEHASTVDTLEKAAGELLRAQIAFHQLRDQLSGHAIQHSGSSPDGVESVTNLGRRQS